MLAKAACPLFFSSKGKKDMMEWMNNKNTFPPLMVLRRYLKLVVNYCIEENLMEHTVDDLKNQKHPFKIEFIPISYPKPNELVLTAA